MTRILDFLAPLVCRVRCCDWQEAGYGYVTCSRCQTIKRIRPWLA